MVSSTQYFRCASAALLLAGSSLADHGPSTTGGGFSAERAAPFQRQRLSASAATEWTDFKGATAGQIAKATHLDVLDYSLLTTFTVGFGLAEHFEVSLSTGYYAADGAKRLPHSHGNRARASEPESAPASTGARSRSARTFRPRHAAHGSGGHGPGAGAASRESVASESQNATPAREFASFDPDGWTDLWLNFKLRLHQSPAAHAALLGGIKFPVGETRVFDSTGARVEPASTPGTGAWDQMAGLVCGFTFAPSLGLDVSAQYIVRGEKFDYRLGDRLDAAAALGWRFHGTAESFPQASLVAEASVRYIEKSQEYGAPSHDTGGTAVFLSPGLRIALGPHAAWNAAVQFPVWQDLNGTQIETRLRVVTSLSISF
jgi:hypothetical protein